MQIRNALGTLSRSFTPLRQSNFRTYLGGQAISLIGTWMQSTAASLVVYKLSGNSPQALGIAGMLTTLPILLLSPWTGTISDRFDRRKLLLITQTVAMVLAFALAALTATGNAELWQMYALTFILGISNAVDLPTQQAFLGDLSGMSEVRKAINLNAMILNVSRFLGPALGGLVVASLGAPVAFLINGVSFAAVLVSLFVVRASQVRATRGAGQGGIGEALAFVRGQPRLQDVLGFVIIMTFLGFSTLTVAADIVNGDAASTGALLSASGLGALVGVVFIVPLAQAAKRTGLVMAGGAIWLGAWTVVFSLMPVLPLQLVTMFLASFGAPVVMTMAFGLTQLMAPPNMRARIISLVTTVSFGMLPLAALLVGFSAQQLGAVGAIRINGGLIVLLIGALLMLRPALRAWQAAPSVQAKSAV